MFMAVADDPSYSCRAAGYFLDLADPQ